jgi:formylglycine-generating enzyme required for sulfatase activity
MSESLSPRQRLKLIDLVNALMQPDFEKLVFAIAAPQYLIPSNFSAQGNRSSALLQWVEGPTGCGLVIFLETLNAIAPGAFRAEPSRSKPPIQNATPISEPAAKPNADFTLDLGGGVSLEMVYIPGGRFWMGSPEREIGRRESEGPQHKVTVSPFYIGKHPITQQQWRAVSLLDDVNLQLLPNPSNFKGDNLPVEQVNWYETVEFCKRLSIQAQHNYRLPSEAEWEYAGRAGTATPFSFGETISIDQANYNGNNIYNQGQKGTYRKKTTAVGNFPANAFGLYDMHGNVWEWCQDWWHKNYEGVPIDGNVWIEGGEASLRVRRGGSWFTSPRDCRSAFRDNNPAENQINNIGFRICCSVPRT